MQERSYTGSNSCFKNWFWKKGIICIVVSLCITLRSLRCLREFGATILYDFKNENKNDRWLTYGYVKGGQFFVIQLMPTAQ